MATTLTPSGQVVRPSRPSAAAPRRRIFNHEMYELAFGTVYTGLMTNVLLVVACLPLVVLLVTTDPAASWPLLALLAPLTAPALSAAFAVFAAFSAQGTTTVVRTFAAAWWRHLRRSLAVGALVAAVVVVAAVDVRFFWGLRVGAAAIPVLATLIAVALAAGLVTLAAVPELPGARLRDVLRAGLYLALRRWYLTAASLVVVGMLGAVVAERPAVGLGLAAAPLLYVVWGGSRYTLRPVLPAASAPAA
jgi:uncharacterized membrane protein YesL